MFNTIRVLLNNTECGINMCMNIGEKIKQARTAAKMSQAQLGIQCGWDSGTPQSRIGNYEQGTRTPSTTDIVAIARALNKSILYFFDEEESTLQARETPGKYTIPDLKTVLEGKKADIELLKDAIILIDDVLNSDPDYHYSAENKAKAIIGVLCSALANNARPIDKSSAIAALRAVSS